MFNNILLGFGAMEMQVAGLPPVGNRFKKPDVAKMAEAIGIKGIRAEKPEDISPALHEAFSHKGPALVDVVVNPTELSMPPKVELDQVRGFGIYALKQIFNGDGAEVWQTLQTNFLGKLRTFQHEKILVAIHAVFHYPFSKNFELNH